MTILSQTGPRPRRGLFAFVTAASAIVVLAFQTGAPSPVYPVYAAEWHLTQTQLSVVFAVYVLGLLVTLLTAGSLSDYVGRRPVAIAALGIAVAASITLGTAGGLAQLIVGRLLQGAAMGLGAGALGAALLDHAPRGNLGLAATLNGALPPVGLSAGAMLGALLVEFAPEPTRTVYVVLGVISLVVVGLLVFLSERHDRRPGALRSLVPAAQVPPAARPVFGAVVGCMMASWAFGGLFLGLGPSIATGRLGLEHPVQGGLAIAAVGGVGAVTGILARRADPHRLLVVGAFALVTSSGFLAVTLSTNSVWLFYLAALVGGVGFGGGFQGGLRMIMAETPAEHRSGVLSVAYIVSYLSFGLPCVAAGLLIPVLGIGPVIDGYAALVILGAATALLLQTRRHAREVERQAAQDDAASVERDLS